MDVCWESCGGIGRKCAFYNGFAGCVPTKSNCAEPLLTRLGRVGYNTRREREESAWFYGIEE